jgi:FAD/FMN-containing dehydrogenase
VADFPDTLFAQSPQAMIVRISAPQQRLAVIIAGAQQAAHVNGFTIAAAGRAVSPVHLAFVPGMEQTNYAAALNVVRTAVGRDGVVVVTHCPMDVKRRIDVWGTTATDFEAIQSVKRTFDPGDILNRGRFLL